jgi:hypothetical protein
LVFEFFEDATQTTNVLGAPFVLDIPQDAATTGGWVNLSSTSVGAITFPGVQAAKSARVTFRKGANATGTVNLDDLYLKTAAASSGWSGDFFNANFDAGDTWYYWWDNFSGGVDTWPATQPFIQTVTDEEAHTGTSSLKIMQNDPTASESVAVSERVPVVAGEPVVVSFWVKTAGVANADSIGIGDNNIGLTALWYDNLEGGAAGYGEIGGLDIRLNGEYNPQVIPLATRASDTGWTQYAFVVYPAENAIGMELRLRYWHSFEGATYWDDVFASSVSSLLAAVPDLNGLTNGGFEAGNPAYWAANGAGAVWSSTNSRTPGHSLELTGAGEASWVMDEAVRNWVPAIPADGSVVPEVEIGGWISTEGVNTAPADDASKFQLVFEFFEDATQTTNVLGAPFVLDIPQDAATTGGWVELSSTSIGAITFPGVQAAKSAKVTFRKGANATGTVNLDDLYLRTAAASSGWAGDFFNANFDAGDTWYYWWDNFSGGVATWPDTQPFIQTVTDAEAQEGTNSLMLMQNDPTASESVAVSDRVEVTPGVPVLVSFWVKTADVAHADSIGIGDNNIGMTALWYDNLEGGAAGYGEIGGLDIRLNGEYNPNVIPLATRAADTEWTNYAFVVNPAENAVGMELRLRYWHSFEGTTYWDNVSILSLNDSALNVAIEEDFVDGRDGDETLLLQQNFPNPFGDRTTITFDVLETSKVSLNVYNVLGQRVATLVDGMVPAGRQAVNFNASELPSGIYLYMLRSGDKSETKTMILVR